MINGESAVEGVSTDAQDTTVVASAEEFSRLVEAEIDRAYRLAGLMLGSGPEAEDAVGDAIERAWEHNGQLRDWSRFRPWLDHIVVNICRDRLRRRNKVRFVHLDGATEPGTTDEFALALERDRLLGAVSRLSDDERVLLVLHYWSDLTLDEVAMRLGWRPGTVRSRLHRALLNLRNMLTLDERTQQE
jgi:RNA polymerase sigma-70 factor (ECF subfamily)